MLVIYLVGSVCQCREGDSPPPLHLPQFFYLSIGQYGAEERYTTPLTVR